MQSEKPSGRKMRTVGFGLRDVSPEQQLAHLNSLVACSHDAIFTTDLDGTVLTWNPAAERIYGYSVQEMIGSKVFKILPPDRQNEISTVVQSIENHRTPEPFETLRIRKDGKLISVYITVSPLRSDFGELVGVSTIARDITARKKAEAAVAQKQRELEDFFENAAIGLHWVGEDGRILWANSAEMKLLGYEPYEYIGHNIAEFHADSGAIEDIICRLKNNENLEAYEARLVCKDRSIRHVLISSSVLWDQGSFVHTRCFTVDVTGKKLAEEALRRTEKLAASAQLTASMAHEINNPLEAVMNLMYLARGEQHGQRRDEYLSMAENELRRVADITRRTLAFFREGPERKVLELGQVVTDVVSVYHSKIEGRQLKVSCDFSTSQMTGFEGEMRQVFANLLLNAIEASPIGGHIAIRVRTIGTKIVCVIADNGPGIERADKRKIFQPFYTTKKETGTGLGLWLSKELVCSHGGTIRFRTSCGKNPGTVFRLTFPALKAVFLQSA